MLIALLILVSCGDEAVVGARLMASLDASGDGALDPAEFAALAAPGEDFSRWDTDRDGRIDPAELEARLWDTSPLVSEHAGAEPRAPR